MFEAVKKLEFQLFLSVACAQVLFFHSLIENLLGTSGFVATYQSIDKKENVVKQWAEHLFFFVKIPATIFLWTALNTMLFFVFVLAIKYLLLDVAKGEVMSGHSSIDFHDLSNIVVGAYKGRLWCVVKNLMVGQAVITGLMLLYARPSKMEKKEGVETMVRVFFVLLLVHAIVLLVVEFILPCIEK